MNRSVTFTLPAPPSINHYWRHQRGRHHISSEGKAYRGVVVDRLKQLGIRPLGGSIACTIEYTPPDRRRRDLDNIQKALLDALAYGGAYDDDSQIDVLMVVRMPFERNRGSVRVTLEPVVECPPDYKVGIAYTSVLAGVEE